MISATTNYLNAETEFSAGIIIFRIEIEGYGRVFVNHNNGVDTPWLVSVDPLSISINDVDGGANQMSLGFTVQDRGAAITGDFPGFVFEGKKVTITAGFAGLATGDYITMFVGFVDTVSSTNSNLEYYFDCSDIQSKLSKVIFTVGDDGFTTSADHIKTVKGHPLDILLTILLTELDLDPSLVDSDKIIAYRDGPFAGVNFVFRLSQSPAGIDFMKAQILKVLGGYLWVNSSGQVTINFFYPLSGPVAVASLGPDQWTAIPTAEQVGSSSGSKSMINTTQFQFDKDDHDKNSSGNYLAFETQEYGPSVSLYGVFGEQTVQADGLRSAYQGYFIAKMVSRLYFLRYGFKALMFDQNAAASFWNTVRIEPGDIVSVTHPNVPNRKLGVMGITDKLFEVINKSIDFTNGLVTLTLIDASYLSTFGFFKITPVDEADYTAASSPDKAKYMFQCNDSDEYSNSDPAHPLG